MLPHRKKIDMQFGYSSSAIPTILSGKTPSEHGHLGLFRFAPETSPFKTLSRFAWLFKPASFWSRGRVRHHLSKLLKKLYGFTGYFQLYRMPIWKLGFVDYCEKRDLFVANGMEDIANLHDVLSEMQINFHISDWHLSDDENYLAAEKRLMKEKTSSLSTPQVWTDFCMIKFPISRQLPPSSLKLHSASSLSILRRKIRLKQSILPSFPTTV
jgi:hypothetical protein